MPDPPDLLTLCSKLDHGGGVLSNSTFVVYTTTTLPTSALQLSLNPELTTLAPLVTPHIPILLDTTLDFPILTSAPYPAPFRNSSPNPINRLPIFFTNAASSPTRCIAGRTNAVESLLAVLRRPWCILELCCATLPAVEALLAFAELAARFDRPGYAAAACLLGHEVAMRNVVVVGEAEPEFPQSGFPVLPHRDADMDGSRRRIRALCAAVFKISVDSFNGFWLRLICVCALELGVSYSTIGLWLGGHGGENRLSDNSQGNCRLPWCGDSTGCKHIRIGCGLDGERRLRSSRSAVELSNRAWLADGAGAGNGTMEVEPKEIFVRIYSRVLEHLRYMET